MKNILTTGSPYKGGDRLFRLLAATRDISRQWTNRVRYSHCAPSGVVWAKDYAATNLASAYTALAPSVMRRRVTPASVPEPAKWIFDKGNHVLIPERFLLEFEKGRVFGEGIAITPDNRIISDTSPDFHRHGNRHWLLSAGRLPQPERVPGTVAVMASPGSANYFHWTLDAVPRYRLLASRLKEIDLFYVDNSHQFHREWLRRLGIPDSKILAASKHAHYRPDRVILPSFDGVSGEPSDEAIGFVRSFMAPSNGIAGKRIFVSRVGSRRRRIVNEQDLYAILAEFGFATCRPGEMTVGEQMTLFASSSHIATPHGAALTNIVFCSPGVRIMELFSPSYINPCYRNLAAVLGLSYSCILGNGSRRNIGRKIDSHHVWANIRISRNQFRDAVGGFVTGREAKG